MTEEIKYPHMRDCPDAKRHTKVPDGYLNWHDWAEKRMETHKQVRCPTCGFYATWIRHDELRRLEAANQIIIEIGLRGRKFFNNEKENRFARLEVDGRGKVWFIESHRLHARVYTHYRYDWKGFSHGGTLRFLVECLRDWTKKGKKLPPQIFGPTPSWIGQKSHWGYLAVDMEAIRDVAVGLEMIEC